MFVDGRDDEVGVWCRVVHEGGQSDGIDGDRDRPREREPVRQEAGFRQSAVARADEFDVGTGRVGDVVDFVGRPRYRVGSSPSTSIALNPPTSSLSAA